MLRVFTGVLLLFQINLLSAKVIQTPVFNWVKPQTFKTDETIPSDQIKDGCFYMVSDRQYNLNTNQYYAHYAYKLVSELGVQNNSEIQLEYNPAYQKFYLHSLKIHRNGKTIDCRSSAKIREIQRVEDLDSHIYDETQTVYIILSDVRPGDIIEYEYSEEGSNPIFGDKFQTIIYFNFSYTLLNFNFRLIKSNKPLYTKYSKSDFKPVIKTTSLGEEWTWESKNNKPVKYEDNAPYWYNQYPYVELSDSKEWEEIEKWGLSVFENNEPLSNLLNEEINKIRKNSATKIDKAFAALRFVQRQIRYLGIEIGINSHKPTPPNKVYQQRYGDCKDKTLLLCKMLKALDIEAYPALISTSIARALPDRLPSPFIFNHAVVKTILYGNEYWFDPTISAQEGDLNNYYFPNYQFGLVLDGKNNGLDSIPLHVKSKIDVQENINIHNLKGYANLYVITTYTGCDADDMRYSVSENGLKEIQDNFLDYYKIIYDSIEVLNNTSIKDDTINNIYTIFEEYQIMDFWKKDSLIISSSIYSYHITNKLKTYTSLNTSRKSPIYLEYPLNIHHKYIIHFPVEWVIEPEDKLVKNDFFEFTSKVSYKNKTCYIDYSFQSFTNNIPAAKSKEFINSVKLINDKNNGMIFTYNTALTKGSTSSSNLLIIFIFLAILGSLAWLAVRIYKLKPKNKVDVEPPVYSPPMLGGWMVLPIIGLVIAPIHALYQIFSDQQLTSATWQYYINGYHLFGGMYLLLNSIFQAFYIVFPILAIVLTFNYDRRVPKFMVSFYLANVSINLFFLFISSYLNASDIQHSSLNMALVRSVIGSAIWIPYYLYSYRVKETFIL